MLILLVRKYIYLLHIWGQHCLRDVIMTFRVWFCNISVIYKWNEFSDNIGMSEKHYTDRTMNETRTNRVFYVEMKNCYKLCNFCYIMHLLLVVLFQTYTYTIVMMVQHFKKPRFHFQWILQLDVYVSGLLIIWKLVHISWMFLVLLLELLKMK